METVFDKITNFLLSQSVHLVILFAVIAGLVWLLNKRSAHIRYLLWLIILIKCLVPPLLTIPVAVLPQRPEISASAPLPQTEMGDNPIHTPVQTQKTQPVYQPQTPEKTAEEFAPAFANTTEISPKDNPIFTMKTLGIVWISGSILYLAWILIRAIRFQLRLKQQRIRPEDALEKEIVALASRFWPGLKVQAYLLEGIGQPFVWGLWRGAIYLPANFAHTTKDRQRHAILLHEMAHIVRADALVNLIQVLAQCVYWFHPLVWVANRMIRAEREKCCDETAIAKLKTTPKEYGGAIVKALTNEYRSRMAIPSLAVAGPTRNIEDRLKTIMNPRRKFYTRPTFIALLAVLFMASIIVPTTIALTHKKAKPEEFAENRESDTQTSDFNAALSNGAKVELVGVCQHPNNNQWWRANGEPVDLPYDVGRTTIDIEPAEGYLWYDLIARIDADDVKFIIPGATRTGIGRSVTINQMNAGFDLWVCRFEMDSMRSAADVKAGAAAGD